MSKYFDEDGNEVTLESLQTGAEISNMELEQYIKEFGFTVEGKQNGPTEKTPPVGPQPTPAGDSSSGDISLESPEIDFSITADDLKADEGEVVAALNAKLSQYGLIAKESTGIGSFNAINIEKRKTKQDEKGFLETIGSAPEAIFKAGYDFFTSFNVGADLSQKELEENAAAINKLVGELADTSYLSKAQEQLGDKWSQFKEAVTPEDKTDKELTKEYKAARLDKFEETRAKYNRINANKFRAAGANQNVKTEEPTIEDFANEEEYNAYLAWQNGDLINDPTKEDLLKFDLERRRAFEAAKSEEFGSDLSISEKHALDALVDNKVKVLEKDIKNFNNLRDKGEVIVNRANDVIEQYNSNPTLDNFDIATAAIKEAREVETAILDNAKALQENLGEKEYIDLAINVLKKDYSRLRQMRNVAKGMAADVWLLGAELDEMMGISYEGEYDKAVALKREVMRESEGFQRNLTIDEISSAKDAGRWVAGAATNLLPSLGLAATGQAALPLFFMTGSGGKLGEMAVAEQDAAMRLAKNAKYLEDNPGIDEIERAAIEMEMAEDAKTLSIDDWRKYGVAAWYGTAEVIFERVGTLHILKNLGKTAKTLKPTSIKEGFTAIGKTWGGGLYREGGSEFATTIAQNVGDIFALGEDKNVFEGGLESFAQGGLMGVSMVSINTPRLVREAVVSELATREESKRLKEIMRRISELTNTPVSNIDLGALGRFGALTPEVRKMVEELTLEQGAIKDQILEGLGTKYNAKDLFKIGEHNRKLRKIESEWAQIASNPNYSPSQLAALEAEYRNKYNAEAGARDQILENEESIAENLKNAKTRSVSFDATQGYAMYSARMQTESLLRINAEFDNIGATQKQSLNEAAKAELEKEGAEITNDSVKNRARKNYVDGKYRDLIEKGRDNVLAYIQANKSKGITPPESFDGDNATADLVARAEALGYQNIEQLKEDLENGITEAINWNGNKLVHMPNAIKNRRVGVFAHEVLHDEAAIGIQSKEGNAAGQVLLDYLEKNQPDLFAQVKDRLDKNYVEVDSETGEARKNKYYQEEALTALSDLLADGYIPSKNIMAQIKLLVSKILPKWAKLSDDAAVYQFVLDYNKAAHFGGKVKQRNPFIRAVGKEPEDKEGKQSRTASAERAKEALDKMQEEGYDPNNFELYDILNGMTGAQLNKYKIKGLQITDMEEAVADVVGRLYTERDVNKFDGRGSLYGYLNGRIKFRILDAFKANPIWVEDFGDVDAEGLTGKEVQKVAVEAVEPAAPVVEKPKYKSLMQRKVLSEQTLETVKKKVLSVTRVLKTRIDAPVSKNVTVTPLAAEIKKAVGKQLDIDFKKEMGGIKDGALRKYLLKNKGAILENMTTTWLMTAMPNAVQKQVGGVWTSDWKGKKIDRETVSTDQAGRTSGAELVRRLPNASTRLSDADFLSNFFTEDGKLIRGRKESLAKAMAEETGFEIIREELKNENSEIAKAFINSQERAGVEDTSNMRAKYEIMAERGNVKFSKSTIKIAEGNTTPVRTELDLELAGRNKTDSLLKENKFTGVYRFKDEGDVDTFIADVKSGLLKTMPRDFFFPTDKGGPLTYSSKIIGASSKDAVWKYYVAEINKLRKLPNSAFGKPVQGVSNFNPPSYKTLFKNEATVLKNKANGKIEAFNKQVSAMHSAMWFRFNEAIQENRENARVIAQFLNFSTSNPKHPNRLGAQFVGYSKGFTEGKSNVTFEHAMPNLAAYLYLLDASLNGGNFDLAYKLVMANYKLIALDKKSDEKLGGVYKTGMPKGWSVINGNWAQRYFNPLVFENDGGIDPESIVMLDGRTLGETAGIKADGTLLSEKSIKFSKSINQEQLQKDKANIADESSVVENDTTGLSDKFNKIIERKTGVDAVKTFSRIQAQLRGKKMGRFKFFIAPSADDFRGLVHYAFAGKGKQGEADMAFFEEKLLTPYFKGIAAIDAMRQQIKREFRTVTKQFKEEYKMLGEQVGDSGFTYDHALRVYMWDRQGTPVEGLSKRDTKLLLDAIAKNPELVSLADALLVVARRDVWPDPSAYWEGESVLADLNSMTEKIGRKKFLEEFIQNADAIFTEDNMNKIEALYGRAHKEAIEDSLYAMKNGTNRPSGANRQVNAWLNWINGSTGAIMFFNRRSALLQMLSFTNFINWSDNNPVKAAAAFANQPQYWKDFAMIFNSDKLKERRGGLKQDVSDSEIADVAGRSKNSPQAVLAYLLKIGFTPTQIADSMAIATGGAMFYRNRVNTYLKQGMDQVAAEEQAFLDFSKRSDEAQQSSDPALVSQQQRSVLGRLILAFANTPMQYTRLMKKAGQDLINGRGDWKENISKIAYYGVVQNFIFSALQSALFALVFDDDEEDDEKAKAIAEKKQIRVINSMLDTVLRGSGIYGAVAATIKNTIVEYFNQEKKGFLSDHTYTVLAAAGISPPIQSKLRKIYSAIQTKKFEADNVAARGWALTADGKLNLGPNYSILGNVLSGVTNVPMDRVVDELRSISEALDARNKAWQRIALALGWKTWDVGVRNEEADLIKTEAKELRKKEGIEKAKKTREETRRKKIGTKEDRKRRARQRRK